MLFGFSSPISVGTGIGRRRSSLHLKLVEREGDRVDHSRLWRVYREAGQSPKRKKLKTLCAGFIAAGGGRSGGGLGG
jgi:hypothetical protein